MIYFLYYTIVIINILFYTLSRNKKKNNNILLIISILILGILFSNDLSNLDMNNYKILYNAINWNKLSSEIAFDILLIFCKYLGFSLVQIRAVVYILIIIFFFCGLRKICFNYHLFISIYMLYLFFIDSIQIKNTIAEAIIFFALTFLIDEENKAGIKYVFFILLASIFHNAAIFFLVFILIKIRNKKMLCQTVIFVTLIMELIIVLNGKRIPFIGYIIGYLFNESQRANQYLLTKTNGVYGILLLMILNCILMYISYHKVTKYAENVSEISVIKIGLYSSVIILLYAPLLWLNVEFYRLPRMLLPLQYCCIINTISMEKMKKYLSKYIILIIFIFGLFEWFYLSYYSISNASQIFEPFFTKSELLK